MSRGLNEVRERVGGSHVVCGGRASEAVGRGCEICFGGLSGTVLEPTGKIQKGSGFMEERSKTVLMLLCCETWLIHRKTAQEMS